MHVNGGHKTRTCTARRDQKWQVGIRSEIVTLGPVLPQRMENATLPVGLPLSSFEVNPVSSDVDFH